MDKNKATRCMRIGLLMAFAALSLISQLAAHAASPAPISPIINGGPLKVVSGYNAAWFLSNDARIVGYVPFRTFAEPFPLTPTLRIRDIANFWGTETPGGIRGLMAATDNGIYIRDDQGSYAAHRWHKWRDDRAKFLGGCGPFVWISPDSAPNEIWQSFDQSAWVTVTQSLSGTILSSVISNNPVSCYEAVVVTQVGDKRLVWMAVQDPEIPAPIIYTNWKVIGELPPVELPEKLQGLPVSFFHNSRFGYSFVAGDTNGKLYLSRQSGISPDDKFPLVWEEIYDFGPGKYPIVLDEDVVTLVDLATGNATYQVNFNYPDHNLSLPFDWQPLGFPKTGQPVAAMYLPNGEQVRRGFGDYNGSLYALTQSGALYRDSFEIDDEGKAKHVLRLLSEKSERTHILFGRADVPLLFDAGQLSWTGARCTGQDAGVYVSEDKALTWTRVFTGTPRQLVRVMGLSAEGKDVLLANTCAGPSLSFDAGITWREAPALNWPFRFGAQYVVGGVDDVSVYAAGQKPTGQPFVLRASFDPSAQTMSAWEDITPAGLGTPVSLASGFQGMYVADAFAVWHYAAAASGPKAATVTAAVNSNAYWVRRAAGLAGARVQSVAAAGVLLAATDKGYFRSTPEDPFDAWTKFDEPYAKPPVEIATSEIGVLLNGSDFAAHFPQLLLMNTPPTECSDVLTNGGMDDQTGWQLPLTRVRAAYVPGGGFGDSDGLRLGLAEGRYAPTSYSTAFQDVVVPADAKRVVLRTFMLRRASANPRDDLQYIRVTSLSRRASVRTLLRSTINSNHWEAQEFDLTAYRGQRVRVLFGVYNDGRAGATSMIVDSVSLLVCQ
jgi:hypothetical protein